MLHRMDGLILALLLSVGLSAATSHSGWAQSDEVKQKRGPLRVYIRPRPEKKDKVDVFVEASKWVEDYAQAIEWDRVLDKDFYAGLEMGKKLSDMQGEDTSWGYDAVYEKMSEYGDVKYGVEKNAVAAEYIYWDTPKGYLNPLFELQHGSGTKIAGYYNYSRYGQYWLLSNMKSLKIANSKFDMSLVNLLDTHVKERR